MVQLDKNRLQTWNDIEKKTPTNIICILMPHTVTELNVLKVSF